MLMKYLFQIGTEDKEMVKKHYLGIIVGTGFDLCEVSCTQRMQSKRKKELFK